MTKIVFYLLFIKFIALVLEKLTKDEARKRKEIKNLDKNLTNIFVVINLPDLETTQQTTCVWTSFICLYIIAPEALSIVSSTFDIILN